MLKLSSLSWKSVTTWLDDNILLVLAGFLTIFIPLYPKLPLLEAIPGYLVRVRVEDFLVLGTFLIWLVQIWRKKIQWRTHLTWVILAYAVSGTLSVLSSIFITKTVPFELLHVAKTSLHLFRYIEYFTLFFIVTSAIKTKKHVEILLGILAITVLGISIYGYGQKYWYWPVYSTMNREFSKGIRLYLTEHARVQSTFGGHYDLGAYLVIALPLLLAWAYQTTKKTLKWSLFAIFTIGVWQLITSASRTSFLAYLAGAAVVVMLIALKKTTWTEKLWWGFSRYSLIFLSTLIMMFAFGDDIYERLLQVLQGYPQVYSQYLELDRKRQEFTKSSLIAVGVIKLPKPTPPPNAISTEEAAKILVPSDQRPVVTKPGDVPSDVYVQVPETVTVATTSASGETEYIEVTRDRTYSDCAKEKGLSLCIRLDTLWPRAVAGFQKNPIFGSGYATLTKEAVYQFTEAESTDNNFLRTLGETGLAGFITFYGVIVLAVKLALSKYQTKDPLKLALIAGYLGAVVGLLINAVYIDVFAASKVAFTFWGVTGLCVAYWSLADAPKNPSVSSSKVGLPTTKKAHQRKKTTKKSKLRS